MFKSLNENEKESVISQLLHGKLSLVGRTDTHSILLIKPASDKNFSFQQFECTYKANKPVQSNHKATLSFVTQANKYLFSANCTFFEMDKVIINPVTEIFTLQRRSTERLYMPEEYYSLVKISYHNGKMVRLFAKMNNISIGGCSLMLRSETPPMNSKDIIKGSMHFNSRPPIDFEGEVRYKKTIKEQKLSIQNFGILFLPSDSLAIAKKMKIVLMDIYRDIFSQHNNKNH